MSQSLRIEPIPYESKLPPSMPVSSPPLKSPLLSPKSPLNPAGVLRPNHSKPKANPIVDLLETEDEYVKDLKILIQRITTSWTHDNPPPPELDKMFCLINDIFKENENFYSSLSKIDLDPKNLRSAQEIADVLMVWVDQMEGVYSKYYQEYRKGFDSWPEIEANESLQKILNDITTEKNQPVMLDYFFELPLKRIYYYKKLYARIYKNSEPGRADYELLTNANQRIDHLLELEKQAIKNAIRPRDKIPQNIEQNDSKHQKNRSLSAPQEAPIFTLQDLEATLDTSRVVDLFTKKPKPIKVNLQPPHLPFYRELKLHDDFIVILPDVYKAHVKAHLFLLSDLLLICQKLSPEEKKKNPTKEYWLLYPPMSGRHLSVLDIHDNKEDLFQITVFKKTDLVIFAENKGLKQVWLREIVDMIEFTVNIGVLARSPTKPAYQGGDNYQQGENNIPLDMVKKSPTNEYFSHPRTPTSPDYPRFSPESEASHDLVSTVETFDETLFQTSSCAVSTWADEWKPLSSQENSYIEIRLTMDRKSQMMVISEKRQKVIFQMFIDQSIHVGRESPCIINVAREIGQRKDYYHINLSTSFEADQLFKYLTDPGYHGAGSDVPPLPPPKPETEFAPRSSSLQPRDNGSPLREKEAETISLMESKCRIFLKNDHAMWTNFGWGMMMVLLETPLNQKRIKIISDRQKKSKLVDAIIWEAGVEKVGKTGVAITINNIHGSYGAAPIIYMIQMKDEATANKAFKIMKDRTKK
ncbi:10666_t:CDS:10 [Acaulospora morrowiae]|uniref:10666_t:CDS:1 n=1 Tax=Acaulospora morrowiae TaxID=94023 RepID=A0A9N9G9B5_9GLOM|nr:10666_t:CDS:10 [Acaulospora morrowiae]